MMKKLTLDDCFRTRSLEASALVLANKIAFNQGLGFSGISGHTYWDFAGSITKQIARLKRLITTNKFTFGPCQRKTRKIGKRERVLYISDWPDRIVERWLNDCLNRRLGRWFSPNSYAYRTSNLGIDKCQSDIMRAITSKSFFIKRDITSYFYSINQAKLLDKLANLVDQDDYLFGLLQQRVNFEYLDGGEKHLSTIGIPFGSPLSCLLANIYLTDMDRMIEKLPVRYFRYADDFLLIANDQATASRASEFIDEHLATIDLQTKPSHRLDVTFQPGYESECVDRFKHLGLEFTKDGDVRLPVEKQRKVINFIKRNLRNNSKLKRLKTLDERLTEVVSTVNITLTDRVRSAAVIDYYLKHITDELQMKEMDLLIAREVISMTLGKRFRMHDFSVLPYKKLRDVGLISLRHRHRLHVHGHLQVHFLSILNDVRVARQEAKMKRRQQLIDQARLVKKFKRNTPTTGTPVVGDADF